MKQMEGYLHTNVLLVSNRSFFTHKSFLTPLRHALSYISTACQQGLAPNYPTNSRTYLFKNHLLFLANILYLPSHYCVISYMLHYLQFNVYQCIYVLLK